MLLHEQSNIDKILVLNRKQPVYSRMRLRISQHILSLSVHIIFIIIIITIIIIVSCNQPLYC